MCTSVPCSQTSRWKSWPLIHSWSSASAFKRSDLTVTRITQAQFQILMQRTLMSLPSQAPTLGPLNCVLETGSSSARLWWSNSFHVERSGPFLGNRSWINNPRMDLPLWPWICLASWVILPKGELWSSHFHSTTWPQLKSHLIQGHAPGQPIATLQWDQVRWGFKGLPIAASLGQLCQLLLPATSTLSWLRFCKPALYFHFFLCPVLLPLPFLI